MNDFLKPMGASVGHASVGHASVGHASVGHASVGHASLTKIDQNQLLVKRIDRGVKLPTKAFETDAGWDIYSNEEVLLRPGKTMKVRTGLMIAPKSSLWGFNINWTLVNLIWDKSGLASKGITVLGGVIDEQYRGELCILMHYLPIGLSLWDQIKAWFFGYSAFKINKGDKICNMILQKVIMARLVEVDDLGNTQRGDGGFGSTGI